MSALNVFSPRRWRTKEHQVWWETAPALPEWLTATVPANCTHTASSLLGSRYYELNIGTAAAVGTEVKLEVTNALPSSSWLRIEVDSWRFDNSSATEADFELYIAGPTQGFSLKHIAGAGAVTVGQFVGQAAVPADSVQLVTDSNGGRAKDMGVEIWPSERLAHVLIEGEIHRTFETPAWPTNVTDLRAGIKMVKRGGSAAKWMRYSGVRLSVGG